MALSVQELQERSQRIGSSDAPIILGVSPWKNVADLYAMKRGLVELRETDSSAADWGNRLEGPACEWLGDRLGLTVERGRYVQSADGLLRAQLDGWIEATGETAEVKCSGLERPGFRPEDDGWGPGGTDALPFHVLVQVQFAMMLAEAKRGHVVALLGGGVWARHYIVEPHPELQAEIERRCRAFWTKHVIPGIPPAEVPSIETLKVVKREPGKSVEVDADLIERYKAIQEQEKLIADAKALAKEKLIHALGDADEGYSPFGGVTFYANKNGVRSLSVKEKA